MEQDRQVDSASMGYKAGRIAGFYSAMVIFVSLFYFIMSYLGRLPFMIEYYQLISFVTIVYAIGIVVWKVRKGAL